MKDCGACGSIQHIASTDAMAADPTHGTDLCLSCYITEVATSGDFDTIDDLVATVMNYFDLPRTEANKNAVRGCAEMAQKR